MPGEPINDNLVTIKTVTTLGEAEIVAAVLSGNGIPAFVPDAHARAVMPHMFTAINTWGVKVQVMARDAQAAAEVLDLNEQGESESEDIREATPEVEEPLSDQYARRAKIAALISLLFTPILLWSLYYAFKANTAALVAPPRNGGRYRLNLMIVLGIWLLNLSLWLLIAYVLTRPDAYTPGPGESFEGEGPPIYIPLL